MDNLKNNHLSKNNARTFSAAWLGRGVLAAGLLLGVGFAGCATESKSDASDLEENPAVEAPCDTPQCDGTPPNPQSKTQPSGPMGSQQGGMAPPTQPPQQLEEDSTGPAPHAAQDFGFGPDVDMGPPKP
jgi:hypothetical protein